MFSGAALVMSVAWALLQPAGPLGASNATVRLHAACVLATDEDRDEVYVDAQLADLRVSLDELAQTPAAKASAPRPGYDTFRQEGPRAEFDLATGGKARQAVAGDYRLEVTLRSQAGPGTLRFEVAVLERRTPEGRPAYEREALRTMIATEPGQKVRLGGLRTPKGDLVIIMWGERLAVDASARPAAEDPAPEKTTGAHERKAPRPFISFREKAREKKAE